MHIVYIWIEQCGCFRNNEFNFTSKYDFHYDNRNGKLDFKDQSKDYVENFFGNQIELTAIVGENGVGKTTLMEFIMTLSKDNLIQTNCIIVCEQIKTEKKELIAYYTDNIECNCSCSYVSLKPINNTHGYRFPESNSLKMIYYTSCFNFSQYHEVYGDSINLSTASCYWREYTDLSELKKAEKNIVIYHYHQEIKYQIDFLTSKKKDVEDFGIKYPGYVTVKFNYYDSQQFLKWFRKNIRTSESEAIDLFDNFFPRLSDSIDNSGVNEFKYRMSIAIFSCMIQELDFSHPQLSDKKCINFLTQLIEVYTNKNNSNSDAWNNLRKFFERQIELIKSVNEEVNEKKSYDLFDNNFITLKAQVYMDFMNFIDNQLVFSDSPFSYINTFNCFTIAFSANIKDNQADIQTELSLFFEKYRQTTGILDYLSFEWNLSSGEMALLNVFSRLFSITKEMNSSRFLPQDVNSDMKADNAIIMIDEADMMLHPAWQQKYIKSLIAFLSDVYKDTHLQLMIATHSPIMLSDIPKQNVVYLHKNNEQIIVDDNDDHAEIFGANIFRLFNDAFFLDEGAIGCFAEKKLADLLEMIVKQANQRKFEIKKRISMVGDVFLRKKIEQIFIDKLHVMNRVEELEDQMKKIQSEIIALKSADEGKSYD